MELIPGERMSTRLTLALAATLALLPVVTHATVKLALRSGASCAQCHFNPGGGGQRNAYGFEEVILLDLPRPADGREAVKFSTRLGPAVRWGADIRIQAMRLDTLTVVADLQGNPLSRGRRPAAVLFPMQAATYFHLQATAQLDVQISYYLLQAAAEFWIRYSSKSEQAYVRAGRFLPAFGIRLDDHTSYTRGGNSSRGSLPGRPLVKEGFPFGPRVHGNGSLEGGLYLGDLFVSGHLSTPSMAGSAARSFAEIQAGLRAEWLHFFGPMTAMAVGSYLKEGKLLFTSLAGGLQWQRLVALAEVGWAEEWTTRPFGDTDGPVPVSRAIMAELDWQLAGGLQFFLRYDRFDHNLRATPLAGVLERWILGAEFFPLPFIEIKPQVRWDISDLTEKPALNMLVQLHAFF